MAPTERLGRMVALMTWAWVVWVLLTWTATVENLVFGALVALVVGCAFADLGPVPMPWIALAPRRIRALMALAGYCVARIVLANLSLTRRILLPSRPLRSGMVIVTTDARSPGELAATGLLTSLVVDNQLVDVDTCRHELQYHAMAVPERHVREKVNAPIERRVLALTRPHRRGGR